VTLNLIRDFALFLKTHAGGTINCESTWLDLNISVLVVVIHIVNILHLILKLTLCVGVKTFQQWLTNRLIELSGACLLSITNKEKGCEWQGEVNDILNHRRSNDVISCPNGCAIFIQRQNLTSHIEDECACCEVTCQYCHIIGRATFY